MNSNGSHCNGVFYVREQTQQKGERKTRRGRGKPKQSSLILSTEKTLKMNTLKPSFYIKFPTEKQTNCICLKKWPALDLEEQMFKISVDHPITTGSKDAACKKH